MAARIAVNDRPIDKIVLEKMFGQMRGVTPDELEDETERRADVMLTQATQDIVHRLRTTARRLQLGGLSLSHWTRACFMVLSFAEDALSGATRRMKVPKRPKNGQTEDRMNFERRIAGAIVLAVHQKFDTFLKSEIAKEEKLSPIQRFARTIPSLQFGVPATKTAAATSHLASSSEQRPPGHSEKKRASRR